MSPVVDIYNPDAYVERVPHEEFRRLRRDSPVYWQALPGPEGRGYWALLKHGDVMLVSRDPATFSAFRGGIVIEELSQDQLAGLRTMLLAMDPPEHLRLRRVVLDAFTPSAIDAIEPWIRERAREIVDAAAAKRDCDFVRDLAGELPLQVINQMMAIPAADRARICELGDRVIGRQDPDFQQAPDAPDPNTELGLYGFQLAGERKGKGGSDLISLMLRAEIDGRPLDQVEFAALFVQIAVAANETSRSLLAGGLLALLDHPQAWKELTADPALLPVAVEEMLRWVTPVHYFRRTATRDVELRGQKIREGDAVALYYTSANFDEEVFDRAERFDIHRDPNPQLAFGWGEHFCLGARLARLEARIFFEEFFRRIEHCELTGPAVRLRSNQTNSMKSIPVRLFPR